MVASGGGGHSRFNIVIHALLRVTILDIVNPSWHLTLNSRAARIVGVVCRLVVVSVHLGLAGLQQEDQQDVAWLAHMADDLPLIVHGLHNAVFCAMKCFVFK